MSKRDKDKGRLRPFVPLLKETLESRAWRATSHGARSLYVALKARYSHVSHNNGRIYLSQRQAACEIGSGFNSIARWFRELQHFGFIVQTKGGSLGLNGRGTAPHWRLTELGTRVGGELVNATCDFLKWDGTKFNKRKSVRTDFGTAARPAEARKGGRSGRRERARVVN